MLERFTEAVKALTRPVLLLGTAGAAFYFFSQGNAEGGTSASTLFGVQAAWWFSERRETHERAALNRPLEPDPLELLRAMPSEVLRAMLLDTANSEIEEEEADA